jgi:hypothetical protein
VAAPEHRQPRPLLGRPSDGLLHYRPPLRRRNQHARRLQPCIPAAMVLGEGQGVGEFWTWERMHVATKERRRIGSGGAYL